MITLLGHQPCVGLRPHRPRPGSRGAGCRWVSPRVRDGIAAAGLIAPRVSAATGVRRGIGYRARFAEARASEIAGTIGSLGFRLTSKTFAIVNWATSATS